MHFLEAPTRLFTSTRLRPSCTYHPFHPARGTRADALLTLECPRVFPLFLPLFFSTCLLFRATMQLWYRESIDSSRRSRSPTQSRTTLKLCGFYSKRAARSRVIIQYFYIIMVEEFLMKNCNNQQIKCAASTNIKIW